ncbi:molecular chaperone [Sphingomonas sp. MMS24-J13]|uniref:fimbrial biogenesis chaperone n=1 Tax=Sphingomonas sp. MMS24-J13 TaxID=3238686 RepID=UPI0038504C98
MIINKSRAPVRRSMCAASSMIAASLLALGAGRATAQSLTVLPVTVQMAAGQKSASLTIINQGETETAVQVRVYAWNQSDGSQVLVPTSDVIVSPPLATVAPSAAQVLRLVLKRQPQGQELTYRILVDQIPTAAAAPGTVKIALRLSIPIFAEPAERVASHVRFHMERSAGENYLVAVNDGSRHEAYRDITLTTATGVALKTDVNASPYILAGATRRWHVTGAAPGAIPAGDLHLTARIDGGTVDQNLAGAAGS